MRALKRARSSSIYPGSCQRQGWRLPLRAQRDWGGVWGGAGPGYLRATVCFASNFSTIGLMAFTFPPKVVFWLSMVTFVSIFDRFGVPIGYPALIFSSFSRAFLGHRICMLFQYAFNYLLVSSKPVESCSRRSGSVI